jgi:hypothetical protein
MSIECRHVRLAIGGDPHNLAPDVQAHLRTCAACTRFAQETLTLDRRVADALALPLARFRKPALAWRHGLALAASVVLAVVFGAGLWLVSAQSALAGEVIKHIEHESGSWGAHDVLPASEVADVLRQAGVNFDMSMPVVYAMACPFRGRLVPHFVVQTANGPMTVMLLAHEKVAEREKFSENGYQGVLLPAGEGSVAVLARGGEVPDAIADGVVNAVRW